MSSYINDTVVFLGPSLSKADAVRICPATYLPPARQTDILDLVWRDPPGTICLIDGEFGQSLSVWHKELLFALHAGVRVVGASSMGALRSAELHVAGMIGLGVIYEWYRSGAVSGDDEVALIYAPRLDYRPLTVPLVDVRYLLQHLVAIEALKLEQSKAALQAARSIHYADRDIPTLARALANGVAISAAEWEKHLNSPFACLKAQDARLALDLINKGNLPRVDRLNWFQSTYCFETQADQDRHYSCGKQRIRRKDLASFIALEHPHYEDLRAISLNRAIVVLFAKTLGVVSNEEDRTLAKAYLHPSTPRMDQDELLEELATCHAMHRWLMSQRGDRGTTSAILSEVSRRGELGQYLQAAVGRKSLLNEKTDDLSAATRPSRSVLIADYLASKDGVLIDDFRVWLERRGFSSIFEAEMHLNEAFEARRRTEALARSLLQDSD